MPSFCGFCAYVSFRMSLWFPPKKCLFVLCVFAIRIARHMSRNHPQWKKKHKLIARCVRSGVLGGPRIVRSKTSVAFRSDSSSSRCLDFEVARQ